MENNNIKWVVWSVGALVAIVLLIIITPFKIVGAGERGVVLRFGAVIRTMSEGLNWKTPIIEHVEIVDVKTQKEQVKASAASKDLQTVTAEVALNYHLDPDKVGELWRTIGSDYKARIIDPAIQESIKASAAKYTAEELITKRHQVKEDMKLSLSERLKSEFIVVDELSITDFDFSSSFNSAIEAKVKAEQEALTQKNKLEQVKYEADQAIAQAKGMAEARITNAKAEAEAIRIQAQAITQQGGAEYVNLKAVEKWNGQLPVQMIPNSTVPFININR